LEPGGGVVDPGVELCPVEPLLLPDPLPAEPAEPALCATTQAEQLRRIKSIANLRREFICLSPVLNINLVL